ncbi:MAG: hypothetical protein ACRYG4_17595 [Janthinobacterium lividum]
MLRYLLVAATAVSATAAHADSGPFAASARVADADLATMRGGFALPNGIDIALAVQMDAAINGALVLRTVFRVDQGSPTLAVYAPAPGTTGPAHTALPTGGNSTALVLDRAAGTMTVQPVADVPTQVAVSANSGASVGAPAGLAPLAATVGGPAVATGAGSVQLSAIPSGTRVDLSGSMIDISQLVGSTFVNSVQNSGNNRVIDTATTINVNLSNTSAMAAATVAARVSSVVDQIASRLIR